MTASLATSAPPNDMVWIDEGEFLMGSDRFYPEEAPVHRVGVDGFWVDEHPVTVAEFRRFVKATGHVTGAEHAPDAADYPGRRSGAAGARVARVRTHSGPVDLRDFRNWWDWTPGRLWRQPEGPGTTRRRPRASPGRARRVRGRAGICAMGGQGPADRGRVGVRGARRPRATAFAWGDEFAPRGRMMANTWHGEFPAEPAQRGYERTSP